MKNSYEVRGDETAIIIISPKHGKFETLISTNRLERAKEFPGSWCLYWSKYTKSYYVRGNKVINGKKKTYLLHRWVLDAPTKLHVDHKNHDTLNNTDSNLRLTTRSENLQNRKGLCGSNSSGVRGVSWHKRMNKWRAMYSLNNRDTHVGYFENVEDAEFAVVEARRKYMPFSESDI